ncbi:hypothetical protein Dimus_039453 [Dionaea muscipula]
MEFERKYYTGHVRFQKKVELLILRQGTMRIPEYEAKFSELARFAPELLETEVDKMFHFERGMDPELVIHVRACRCSTLDEMVEQATRLEDAMVAARGSAPKRGRDDSVQSQPQSGGTSDPDIPLPFSYCCTLWCISLFILH